MAVAGGDTKRLLSRHYSGCFGVSYADFENIVNIITNMIKKLFIGIIAIAAALQVKAQHDPGSGVPDHTPMMTEVWETFDLLMYKVTRTDGKSTYTPHFPPKLQALENKTVTLPGYMVPIESGRQHSNFMLS